MAHWEAGSMVFPEPGKAGRSYIMLSIWDICPRMMEGQRRLWKESDMFRITFSINHFRYGMRIEGGKEEMLGIQLRSLLFPPQGERNSMGLDGSRGNGAT